VTPMCIGIHKTLVTHDDRRDLATTEEVLRNG
jgi:hypothetical protein